MAQTTVARAGADAPVVNKPLDRRAPWPLQFWRSAVGKKWIMAITGIAMWGFVFAHMFGNLKLYLGKVGGRYDIDIYGEELRRLLVPLFPKYWVLWILRAGLILMFVLHIVAAASLTQMNRRARPVGYQSSREYVSANFASRSMRITGVIVLGYLFFHLFDLSWTGTGQVYIRGAVHDNVIASMQRPWAAIAYIVGNIALAIHLFHGTWSMFQTMGLNNPRYNYIRRFVALGMSGVIGIGNCLFPLLIVTKVVK